jgi:hypothetical protein
MIREFIKFMKKGANVNDAGNASFTLLYTTSCNGHCDFVVSHTELCNFFRHSTLISSCVPLHVAFLESLTLLYDHPTFVLHLSSRACTVLPRHPQHHRASCATETCIIIIIIVIIMHCAYNKTFTYIKQRHV